MNVRATVVFTGLLLLTALLMAMIAEALPVLLNAVYLATGAGASVAFSRAVRLRKVPMPFHPV